MFHIKKDSILFMLTLAMLAALPPFAVNTYAPAIPNIAEHFNVYPSDVIFTFTTYFIGFATGMIIWGTLSDKFGRKKMLLAGLSLYAISTLLCAHSATFNQLAVFRLIQGLTDSSGTVIALAIARDCYNGKKLTAMLSTLAMIMLVAPVISPMIGTGLIVTTESWESSFYFLFGYGVLLILLCSLLPETHPKHQRQSGIKSFIIAYFEHIRNTRFIGYSTASGLFFAAFFSYIGSASIIYLNIYSTGYVYYMLFFAMTILGVILANFTLKTLSQKLSLTILTRSGVIIALFGVSSVWLFAHSQFSNSAVFTLLMLISCYGLALSSTTLLSASLQEVSHHFGAATALNNFLKFSLAGVANFLMSFSIGTQIVKNLPSQQLGIIAVALVILLLTKRYSKS